MPRAPAELAGGETQYIPGTVDKLDESSSPIEREFYDFYRATRGACTRERRAGGSHHEADAEQRRQVRELLPVQ
jgi:hypothetical protein